MEDYIKPTVKLFPKQIILICGTNNLPSSEDPETIAKNIITITKNIKADKDSNLGYNPKMRYF